jgi:predicted MFS family arabinose efflux permease
MSDRTAASIPLIPPLSWNSGVLVVVAFLVTFGVFMVQPYLFVYVPAYVGWSSDSISLALLAGAVLGSAAALATSASIPTKRVVNFAQTAAIGLAVGFAALTAAPSGNAAAKFVMIIGALFCYRFSLSLLRTCAYTIQIMSTREPDSLPRTLALMSASAAAGATLGPLLASQLSGISTILFVADAVLAAGAGVTLLLRPAGVPPQPDKLAEKAWRHLLKAPTLAVATSSMLLYVLLAQMFSYVPLLVKLNAGSSADSRIAQLFAIKAVIVAVLPPFVTRVTDRLFESPVHRYLLGLLLAAAGMMAFTALPTEWVCNILGVALLSVGEIVGSTYGVVVLNSTIADRSALTAGVGLYTFATLAVGIGVGQYLGVVLAGQASSASLMTWLGVCFAGFGVILFAGIANPPRRVRAVPNTEA